MKRGIIAIMSSLPLKKDLLSIVLTITALLTVTAPIGAQNRQLGVNVLLNVEVTDEIIAELEMYGSVLDMLLQINAVHMRASEGDIPVIQALPSVDTAIADAERSAIPVDVVEVDVTDFSEGYGTWDLDAIDVMLDPIGNTRDPQLYGMDGEGVYIAVLDTGLLRTWRQYFPEQRIVGQYAISFDGGGQNRGYVSEQPNKWEHDTDSHGTHVTSTILGYNHYGLPVNGVAPMATVIPVKVLNQNGQGWASIIARGIIYVADLKKNGPLSGSPVVINMSLGGPGNPMEEAAINYAISQGVIVVASAGNRGTAGMSYPGGYGPEISVAASGWIYEWVWEDGTWPNWNWWWNIDLSEPTNPADCYIANFSSRELPGQDLDVAAPGSWVVGPYQMQSGQLSWYFLGGTSMASPHVAGIVALMLQKNPNLTAAQAESILESTAIPLGPGSRTVQTPWGTVETHSWGADATGAGLANAVNALAATP